MASPPCFGRCKEPAANRAVPPAGFLRQCAPLWIPGVEESMTEPLPILYVKSGCGWCQEATDFLSEHGIGYREVNVSEDSKAYAAMERVSGQTKAPVLDWRAEREGVQEALHHSSLSGREHRARVGRQRDPALAIDLGGEAKSRRCRSDVHC